jgi:hypothetical protein
MALVHHDECLHCMLKNDYASYKMMAQHLLY